MISFFYMYRRINDVLNYESLSKMSNNIENDNAELLEEARRDNKKKNSTSGKKNIKRLKWNKMYRFAVE